MTPASTSNKRALVVGGNSMALSHAALLAHHGFEAVLMEDDEIDAVRSRDFLKRFYEGQPSWAKDSSKPNPLPFKKLDGRFDVLIDTSDAGLDRRCQILSTVSKCLNPDALIAFQTSTPDLLTVEKITATLPTIHQFHICGQPHLATLVECAKFAGMNIDPLSQFWQTLGKQVILTKPDGPFVASRLSATLYEALDSLLLEGALPYEIDEALTKFGFQIGPYEAQDLTGLDGPFYERKQANKTLLISDRMVQEGRLGKKVGVGWYRYPGGGGSVIDPLLEDLIVEEAHFAKIERRSISDQEIVSRVVSSLSEEAAFILKNDIAPSASDLDKLSMEALHFPHDGICSYADKHCS